MPDRTEYAPDQGSTPTEPAKLTTRSRGAAYSDSSTYRRPAATAFDEPQPSRPTRPFGAPDIGTDTITSNPTDGDDL